MDLSKIKEISKIQIIFGYINYLNNKDKELIINNIQKLISHKIYLKIINQSIIFLALNILAFKKNVFEFFEHLDKLCILNYKLYILHFSPHINNHFIKVYKIKRINNNYSKYKKKYKNLKEIFDRKKLIIDKLDIQIIEFNNIFIKKFQINFSNIVCLKNFLSLDIFLSKSLNLFTIFGIIENIFYDYYNNIVYIQYSKQLEVNRIIDANNYLNWNNNKIKLEEFKISKIYKNYIYFIEFNFSKKFNRKKYNFDNYNKPSKAWIFSNLSDICKFKFFLIVSEISEPSLWNFFYNSNNNMYSIMMFNSINDSLKVIIKLNNKILKDKKIKITFSFNRFVV